MREIGLNQKYKQVFTHEMYVVVAKHFATGHYTLRNLSNGTKKIVSGRQLDCFFELIKPPFLNQESKEVLVFMIILLSVLAGLIWYA